ncbi:FAD-dependent oxidoreductase [Alteraurantiacibacter aestuarii]|uniref:NAD(P)-binding protein n=1 Tax=Alteraurantiacibacter aestuarii TaxID=650004 RepID=A0A844ZKU6_9SPHN|nr:FAD-dependent oxidoreductase [Alteraurantiacibacter aestuarii]MXO88173.1 NAD(P)-binding protein [Alteraurantiacibacter aestuarii]
MKKLKILIIGGGIGGLTSAIALRRDGHDVTVIEKDPDWAVYGVGIIQQANVIRAMKQLDLLEDYVASGVPFDKVAVHMPDGTQVAVIPIPPLVEGYPASMGIGRPALHKILGERTVADGAEVRLGITAKEIDDRDDQVRVRFSDDSEDSYDLVIGADGVYSDTRGQIMPDAPRPEFTGQAVWRYNFPRPADLDALHAYNGPIGAGLVPINEDLMYMYVTTPEPDKPRYDNDKLAQSMREKVIGHTAPQIRELAAQITDNDGVVYRPLEAMMLYGAWHSGRVVLLGDAVHATTPHLGQGAGMAIEDSIVLAEEIAAHDTPEDAFMAYRDRRFERCKYIVESSLAICHGQLGKGPPVDNAKATAEMFAVTAEPI